MSLRMCTGGLGYSHHLWLRSFVDVVWGVFGSVVALTFAAESSWWGSRLLSASSWHRVSRKQLPTFRPSPSPHSLTSIMPESYDSEPLPRSFAIHARTPRRATLAVIDLLLHVMSATASSLGLYFLAYRAACWPFNFNATYFSSTPGI
jgi:hypothetical protein